MTESNRDTQGQGKGRDSWNHRGPVVFSPLFDWPPNPRAFVLALTKRWVTLSRNALFLIVAWLVYRYFLPDLSSMRSLSIEWALPAFLRNLLLMTVITGGLHLYWFPIGPKASGSNTMPVNNWRRAASFRFATRSGTTCFSR